jgi:hypothetical protein
MKLICTLMALFSAAGCDGANTSDSSADYATVRVKQLVLSDAEGRPVVFVSARRAGDGKPALVVSGPTGAVLRTIELSAVE